MTKSELTKLLKQIAEDKKLATAEIPPTVYPNEVATYQIIRTRAQERVLEGEIKYRDYVNNHMGGMILIGTPEQQESFAKLAKNIGETINFDTNEIYRKATESAFFMMGGTGSLTADQLALVYTEIRYISRELGIFRLRDPMVDWMFQISWQNKELFSVGIRESFYKSNGIKLSATALQKFVQDEALRLAAPNTTIPVVVMGVQDNEIQEFALLFTHGSVVVDLRDVEVNEEFVTQAFNALIIAIKNQTQNPMKTQENTNG